MASVARDAALDDLTVFVDVEVFVEDVAEGEELVNGRSEAAEAGAERSGGDRDGEAGATGGDLVRNGFGGGPVELEVAGVEIVEWVGEEHD